jgi:hypothetical protein
VPAASGGLTLSSPLLLVVPLLALVAGASSPVVGWCSARDLEVQLNSDEGNDPVGRTVATRIPEPLRISAAGHLDCGAYSWSRGWSSARRCLDSE